MRLLTRHNRVQLRALLLSNPVRQCQLSTKQIRSIFALTAKLELIYLYLLNLLPKFRAVNWHDLVFELQLCNQVNVGDHTSLAKRFADFTAKGYCIRNNNQAVVKL